MDTAIYKECYLKDNHAMYEMYKNYNNNQASRPHIEPSNSHTVSSSLSVPTTKINERTTTTTPNNENIVNTITNDANYDMSNIDVTAKDSNGNTVIDVAIEKSNVVAVAKLLTSFREVLLQKNKHGDIALCTLLKNNSLKDVLLLDAGIKEIIDTNILVFLKDKGYKNHEIKDMLHDISNDYTLITNSIGQKVIITIE